MVRFLLGLIILVYSIGVFSGTKQIECSESSCNPDFIPTQQTDKLYFTSIDIGDYNQDNIYIKVNNNGEPRSVRMSVNNNTVLGKDLSVDLTPNSDNSNAGDFLVIGDYLNNIEVNLNGYNGLDGKNTSKLCYEEYELQDDGAFGSELKEKFDDARFLEPTLPRTQCVSFDIDNLFDSFQCDDGYQEIEDVINPSVIVERLRGKNRCLGLGYINVCVSETVQIECTYRVKYTSPTFLAGTFDSSDLKKEVRILTMPKLEYEEKKYIPGYQKFLCDNLSYIEGINPPEDIIQNGEFYFNIAGWTNTNAIWDTSEELKLLPDLEELTQIPYAQQVLTTIPGERYRVQVNWSKDLSTENIDSGSIAVYSDIEKNSIIHQEKIFEENSIPPVFLTSDDAPYDFGFVLKNSSLEKTFTIKNKDTRDAVNCSVVYLDGDTTTYSIKSQTCGTTDLSAGGECSVTVRANPITYGKKDVVLKRDCEDDYGNYFSTLNEEISIVSYENYIQPPSIEAPDPNTKFIDGFYWRFDISGNRWLKCDEDFLNGKNCFSTAEIAEINDEFIPGKWFPGFLPPEMTHTPGQIIPTSEEPVLLKKIAVPPVNRIASKEVDFIFTASQNISILELKSLLPQHGALFDKVIVTKLSPTAGPSIKAPLDLRCPSVSTPGCVSGSLGFGYYDLAHVDDTRLTQPGINEDYYTVPSDSDWRIRYVDILRSCPKYFYLKKREHLASNIGYDDNDNLCDDVYIPEDPSSKLIQWQFVNFERKAEFGTELVQCTAGNCLVNYSIQEKEKNLVTFNLGSGTNGTQQGEGLLFVYDFNELTGTAINGTGGSIGINDLPLKKEPRVCAKINDAVTEGINSDWAKDPKVNFLMYNWQPIDIIDEGNFGKTPRNNGKNIQYYKKIDSSVRYLMKNEIF